MEQYADVVIDLEGNAIQGATVQIFAGAPNAWLQGDFTIPTKLYDSNGTQQDQVVTDGRGAFAFQAPNGKYVLQVKVRGTIYATIGPHTFYDPADDTDRVSASALSAFNGGELVGFGSRTEYDKLSDFVSVMDIAPVDNTGTTDTTQSLQAAINQIIAQGGHPYIPYGAYLIDTLIIKDAVYNVSILMGNPIFYGIATVPRKGIIQLINCVGLTILGTHRVHGQDNINYDRGMHVGVVAGTSQATTRVNVHNPVYYNVLTGQGFGVYDVDYQCSEITIFGPNFFRCPIAIYNGGSNTGIQVVGGNVVSERSPGMPGAPEYAVIQEGGFTKFVGCSIFTNPTANYGVSFRPCKTASGNLYGTFNLVGSHCEVNSPLLKIENPAGLSAPVSTAASVTISNSPGFCGAPAAADFCHIADATYAGSLNLTGNNWYAPSVRSGANIKSESPSARITVDAISFGQNFKDAIGGVVGGIVKHDLVPIVAASGISATIPAGAQIITYANIESAGAFARHAANYSGGVYTVSNGITSVRISARAVGNAITPPAGDFLIKKNDAIMSFGRYAGNVADVSATLYGLVNGDLISVVLQGNAPNTFDGGPYQQLLIEGAA